MMNYFKYHFATYWESLAFPSSVGLSNSSNKDRSKERNMILTLKTLDHKILKYEVSPDETVHQLKSRIEDDLGRENLYRLIYSGKILKDDQLIKDYKINEKQFVVLMITKPHNAIKTEAPAHPETEQKIEKEICEEELTESEAKSEEVKETDEIEIKKDEGGELIGLDWIEEQIKEKEKHFLTDKDFIIALDVVMEMEYLSDLGCPVITEEEMEDVIQHFFQDKQNLAEIRQFLLKKVPQLISVKPNVKQLDALLCDLLTIYSQERDREETSSVGQAATLHSEDEANTEEDDILPSAFQRNLNNIVAMGFLRDEVEVALRAAFNNPDQAVDYLLGGIPPSVFAPEGNPLAFLRTNEEFQKIRYLVQANPDTLQPLLLSFGQKHPELMDTINQNKLSFVRMLHEPDGAKGFGDDSSLVIDNSQNPQSHSR